MLTAPRCCSSSFLCLKLYDYCFLYFSVFNKSQEDLSQHFFSPSFQAQKWNKRRWETKNWVVRNLRGLNFAFLAHICDIKGFSKIWRIFFHMWFYYFTDFFNYSDISDQTALVLMKFRKYCSQLTWLFREVNLTLSLTWLLKRFFIKIYLDLIFEKLSK